MQALTPEFLESCPHEKGFRMRGSQMTRIEVFVDAAFAFAVTMLVISFDAIPRTAPEMVVAIKTIPAFAAAVAQLVWIWHTHTVWCQRYGIDDQPTVWLSALLLIVVLVYIYPMRLMLEGFFAWITGGYLPSTFDFSGFEELRFMFVFLGSAFAALSITFVLMYRYALRKAEPLLLNATELARTRMVVQIWAGCLVIGLALVVLALLLPGHAVPYSGFVLFLIGGWHAWVEAKGSNRKESEPGVLND